MRVPFRMDPAEERRETKRQKEFINMQGYVADSEYGIPTRCPCGGRIIVEVRGKDDYDTRPGKRFFTCKNYVADGFHYRQPWVIGVQEHIECRTKRVEEVELVIKWVLEVNNQIERLEAEVKALNREVDNLTGQMDPAEERRDTKRQKEFINMQGHVADSEYGIPTRCPCGGRIIDEVRGKDDYDTLPGKWFFTCKKLMGFIIVSLWVIGVQEHIERLTKRVEEVELVIKWVSEVNNQIERLEAEVKALHQEVDNLTGQVYNLSVQVADLEKLCFD
ncbi:hypothetical protein F2Q69_00011381 [Brassica cretica]|uniref:Zinc finger GRF-type domain-containing protein n=1 Tax=Brassica cretica TaxID=69181 RepID=A0A8S9R380_BRACR|nr:hypothetical protein F2Q69_00011381 [Brassica cretica]